jgi:hypothetical protein
MRGIICEEDKNFYRVIAVLPGCDRMDVAL